MSNILSIPKSSIDTSKFLEEGLNHSLKNRMPFLYTRLFQNFLSKDIDVEQYTEITPSYEQPEITNSYFENFSRFFDRVSDVPGIRR